MVIIGVLFNPMNILVYRLSDLYISQTLFYGGLLMGSNMVWAHEIVRYLSMGHFDIKTFLVGLMLSVFVSIFLLRQQILVDDEQWLKRMVSHHSTALTTSHKIFNKTNNPKIKKLAEDIINTQDKEIDIMKSML